MFASAITMIRVRVWLLAVLLLAAAQTVAGIPALALEPVDVADRPATDLLAGAERVEGAGQRLLFSTAPDAEGIVRRVEVRSRVPDASGDWVVFALANPSDRQIDRLIVAPHTTLAGSGWWGPDLASRRIAAITPSEGFALEGRTDGDADVFQVTLDPGAVVTFAAELAAGQTRALPELSVWDPDARRDSENAFTLYRGMVLGIGALAATFLLVLFVAHGTATYGAALVLGTATLAFAALRFGFLSRVLALDVAREAIWQAWMELAVAAGLVLFLFAYLSLQRWHRFAVWGLVLWISVLAGAAVLAPLDAASAATAARVSMASCALLGLVLGVPLAFKGFDRGQSILPVWFLLCAWVAAGWAVVSGQVEGEVAEPALVGGLVLLAAMVTVTVAQHVFRSGPALPVDEHERRALALEGAGDAMIEWDVLNDRVRVEDKATAPLGLRAGALDGALDRFADHVHAGERDRFATQVRALAAEGRGRLDQDLRLRAAETGNLVAQRYNWFRVRLRPVRGRSGEVETCIGTMTDVTAERTSRERLLHDAVHDSLTGLPNRELLIDRMRAALVLSREAGTALNPALFLIDLDRFSHINETFGATAADNLLVSMARRLLNVVRPQDCLARIGGDQFALLVLSEPDPEGLALLADRLQRAVRLPVSIEGKEIAVTASLGLVGSESSERSDRARAEAMIADAEIAVAEAKRLGGDRVEPFRPAMRRSIDRDYHLENGLRHALLRREIEMHYQPIVDLSDGSIAGFEALMRWRSPERGLVSPDDFIPIAERNGMIVQLGVFALRTATQDAARFQAAAKDEGLFVSVNISSRQLLRHDLIADVKGVLDDAGCCPGTLKLELTESMVMDNPEQASIVLGRVKALGATLALDDFGTGHSSLSQLTRFPFDTVKIDRSLVRGADDDARPVVLRALVAMTHDLGMDVVAEGIEEDDDARTVRALGCRYGQGFLYGEAMSAKAALGALKKGRRRKAKSSPDAEKSQGDDEAAAVQDDVTAREEKDEAA